jgi:hypothetical protein
VADFCKQCSVIVWGGVFDPVDNDMAGLCEEDEMVAVLCEHCGHIFVNHLGECITPDCMERHGEQTKETTAA